MRNRLLRLYPRRWRERYGEEMAALLEHTAPTGRVLLDLLLGALDAHAHPGLLDAQSPRTSPTGRLGCHFRRDPFALWAVGLYLGALLLGALLLYATPLGGWSDRRDALNALTYGGLAAFLLLYNHRPLGWRGPAPGLRVGLLAALYAAVTLGMLELLSRGELHPPTFALQLAATALTTAALAWALDRFRRPLPAA
jgi:hypothetical protein